MHDEQTDEQIERRLMRGEEIDQYGFERDCAKEWDKRRSERVYSSVDGEEFGREGFFRVDRFGYMEIYVGEFDDDPPQESTLTEDREEYVGGAPPPELLNQERLDNDLMCIGIWKAKVREGPR